VNELRRLLRDGSSGELTQAVADLIRLVAEEEALPIEAAHRRLKNCSVYELLIRAAVGRAIA